ncbi:uncharacterized protein [Centruroides vittatus]|uniref:uncharacterized protein n=1 Tax=Centruroides vittatus TaxID=120091 RepID=UPI0035102975
MATELRLSNGCLMASGGRRLQRTSSFTEITEKKQKRKMFQSLGREGASPEYTSYTRDTGFWNRSKVQPKVCPTPERQSPSHLMRTNTVPQRETPVRAPLIRRHSTTTGRTRVRDTSCQTELDVFDIGKGVTGLWYLNQRDTRSQVNSSKGWKEENSPNRQAIPKVIHPEISGIEVASPKPRCRRSHSLAVNRPRLSTDTAFSETSLVESVDSSGDGGSCFSADIESDSDFVTDDEETWENPKQPLLAKKKNRNKLQKQENQKVLYTNEALESVNGNICEGQSSVKQQNTLNTNENSRPRRPPSPPEEYELENIKCSEEGSSTIESSSNDSESSSPSDESSSCPCEDSSNGETEEECPQCLQELAVDERALSPEVVVINEETEEQQEEHNVVPENEPKRLEPSSPVYLKPPMTINMIGDIMHTGKPIPDDLEEGSDTGGCRRLSEEEFVATLNIHEAARNGDLHVVKLLLKRDSKRMETVDERGWTPIHLASANGHSDVVKFLALEGAHLAALDPSGYNAIHIAAMNGHHDCIEVLLRMGVDVDTLTADGFTPLHLATMNSYVDCCRTLLRWGASLEKEDALGRNIHDMIEEYSLDEVQIFLEIFQQDCLRLTMNKR